jgi:hypothetical protein
MAKLAKGFHLFGTDKVFVRSLIIYKCIFAPNAEEDKAVSITRTHIDPDGSYRREETHMDYAIFSRGGTFHLHDLFLNSMFGITVTLLNGKGNFEIFDLKSDVPRHPLLVFQKPDNEEVLLLSHVEATQIR